MPPARNFGLLIVKLQAIEGTAETTATNGYAMPIMSGMLGPTKEWGDLPRQGNTLTRQGRYAQRASVGGTVTVMAHPEALGLLFYLAMGTELAVQGAGAPYAHTFVMADSWPAPATVWASLASGDDADVWRFRDAYISRLRIVGESGGNLAVDMDWIAKHYTKPAAGAAGFPTDYDDPAVLMGADPRFKFIESVVKLDSDSDTPLEMDNVESVSFEIDRNPEIRYGPSLTPKTLAADRMVNFNADVMYSTGSGGGYDRQGWNFLEDAYLSALNEDPDQSTPAGSFDSTFGIHPADADVGLRIVSGGGDSLPNTVNPQANWEFETARPDAAETPTLVNYSLNGICRVPAEGTTEATVIVSNERATLYDTGGS